MKQGGQELLLYFLSPKNSQQNFLQKSKQSKKIQKNSQAHKSPPNVEIENYKKYRKIQKNKTIKNM
jgi:hypothetical protein